MKKAKKIALEIVSDQILPDRKDLCSDRNRTIVQKTTVRPWPRPYPDDSPDDCVLKITSDQTIVRSKVTSDQIIVRSKSPLIRHNCALNDLISERFSM